MAPLKLAVIGGGPSAFYVASRLLQSIGRTHPYDKALRIHIYDRLWSPHGLVRYGVAPDHPEVKNCTHKFDAVADDPRIKFFGNVNVGSTPSFPHTLSIDLDKLFPHYTHVLMASGCTVPRLHPALPPSNSCRPALSLVHWYTLHPSLPSPPALDKISHVTIVGQGNVSLDVARILLTEPSHLSQYDVPQHVVEQLSRSSVKHVSIVGRRGPLEAAFTTKELREMMNLPQASMIPFDKSLVPTNGQTLTRQQMRTLKLLEEGSKNASGSTPKTWSLDFFRSPTGLITPSSPSSSSRISLSHTMLDAEQRAISTGETSILDTDLVITSLGHRAEPFQAWYEPALGHLRNIRGRIIDTSGHALKNVYASGWAATGAKGVLASTLLDANAVSDTIVSDYLTDNGRGDDVGRLLKGVTPPFEMTFKQLFDSDPHPDDPPPEISKGLKDGLVTDYRRWKAIDEEEVRRGKAAGKERERMDWDGARSFLEGWTA